MTVDTNQDSEALTAEVEENNVKKMAQPKWWLWIQALWWRAMMKLAVVLHDWPAPRPYKPTFRQRISTTSPDGQLMDLLFYVPPNYNKERVRGHRYPVVVNFHGGGFTLGKAADDRRWARMVVDEINAVFVSVEYRRAPEYPFPAAVDDGVDALLYLASVADDLGLDTSKVILTGFSAGANLAFTVPLRLQMYSKVHHGDNLDRYESTTNLLQRTEDNLRIVSVVSWYPLLDMTISREAKRARSIRPDRTLPAFFTNLFDDSYAPTTDWSSPYISPAKASNDMLVECLPQHVDLYLCEWDMLLQEGQLFGERLRDLGKSVTTTMIEGVPHAWDKSANPFRQQSTVDVVYKSACVRMREVLEQEA